MVYMLNSKCALWLLQKKNHHGTVDQICKMCNKFLHNLNTSLWINLIRNLKAYEVSNIFIRPMVWFLQEKLSQSYKMRVDSHWTCTWFISICLSSIWSQQMVNEPVLFDNIALGFVMASTLCISRARIERVRNAWPFLQFSVHMNSVHTQITTARRKMPNRAMTPIVIAVNKRLSPMKYPFSTIFDKESVTEYFFKKMVLV